MEKLTAVFPIAAVAFILLVFSEYLPILRKKPAMAEDGALPAVPEKQASKRMTRKDGVAVLIITAAYAITAFFGLGDTVAPQSFCKFEGEGEYALIDLGGEKELSSVMYYTGLYTGSYYFQTSLDGEEWTDAVELTQKHSDLFKWLVTDFTEEPEAEAEPESGAKAESGPVTARYVRLISGGTVWMGELAMYDIEGNLLDSGEFTYSAGSAPLFDEQELVPEKPTYLNGMYFDEIYHGRTAYENVENIYPYEISHPPLGKLIISIGIRLFGMTPFGWRFMGTLFGVLMLPILYVFLKKMFGSVVVPTCCTLIFAFDFMHFVQTRIATIDTYAVFFILLMYLFMYIYLTSDRTRKKSQLVPLALCGLFFGLGAASKWTCIYAGGGLAVLWLADRIYRGVKMCRAGESRAFARETALNVSWCLLFFVVVPCVIYYLSYIPYGTAKGYDIASREYYDIVINNQKYMFNYHSGVTAEHPYSSWYYEWILNLRPILYYLRYYDDGTRAAFGAFLNPMLCWGGLAAMLMMVYLAIFRRDKKAAFILLGYLAQLVPWMFITRITFAYHYFPCAVFLTLALGHVFSSMRENLAQWKRPVISFTAVSLALFAVFYPALTGITIPSWYSSAFLSWLPRWPF